MAEEQKIVAGLAGIAVGESSICTVGQGLGLNYRGYDIKGNLSQPKLYVADCIIYAINRCHLFMLGFL